MPEIFEQPKSAFKENLEEISESEKEISNEKIETLPDWVEPGSFYRGVKASDALQAIFGKLRLEANPKDEILVSHDNASINLQEAIYLADSSETKKHQKFLCAIGLDPLPGAYVESSKLKSTFVKLSGPVKATEVVVRLAGKEPGKPAKVRFFSPKEFYYWYQKNCPDIYK